MTSNQLAYWRLKEDQRSNMAKEGETARHNLSDEDIRKVSNEISAFRNQLQKEGIQVDKAANLAKIMDTWAKYGTFASNQLPEEAREAMYEALGVDWKNIDPELTGGDVGFNQFWNELRNFFGDVSDIIGSVGKGVGALF